MVSRSAQEHAGALLALHASRGNSARGPMPEEEELALLLEGRLDFARRQEIYSHLNANPELYRRWLALVESSSGEPAAANTASKKTARWRFAWLTGSGALAAVTAVLLIAPWHEQAIIPATQTPQVMDLPPTAGTRVILPEEIKMVAAGLLDTVSGEQREYRARLRAIAMPDASNTAFRRFGASLGTLHNACAAGGPIPAALLAHIQSQAQALPWPPGVLSLSMARMGMEQDLCALAEEARGEILWLGAP